MNTILTDDEIQSLWNYVDLPWEEVDPLRYTRAVEAAVLAKLREQEPVAWPEPPSNFQEGQWWVRELDSFAQSQNSTDDQKRAVAVVHHLLAAVAAPQPAVVQVPQGWKLVPVEPTPAMLKELGNSWDGVNRATWQRVIAAAPEAPAQPSVPAPWREAVKVAREALTGFIAITSESRGVAGYHLNGDTAEWDEFDEVDAAAAALAQLDRLEGGE